METLQTVEQTSLIIPSTENIRFYPFFTVAASPFHKLESKIAHHVHAQELSSTHGLFYLIVCQITSPNTYFHYLRIRLVINKYEQYIVIQLASIQLDNFLPYLRLFSNNSLSFLVVGRSIMLQEVGIVQLFANY